MKIVLESATSKLQVVLGAVPTTELPIVVSYVDVLTSTQAISAYGSQRATTNGTTPVDILGAPASGHTRTVIGMTIPNINSADTVTVTLRYNDNGTIYKIIPITLDPGDTIIEDGQ
jgi:hypothetical protein